MDTWTVAKGRDGRFQFWIRDIADQAVSYAGTEALTGAVWTGDDVEPVLVLAPAWDDPEAGTVTVTIPRAGTATLEPGRYRVEFTVEEAGDTIPPCFECVLEITASPTGTAASPPVYCSRNDLTTLCPWIDEAEDLKEDQTGFAEQRAWARVQIEANLLARAEDRLRNQARLHGPVAYSAPLEITLGVDAGPAWGTSIYPDTTLRDQLDVLRGYLADDLLIVSDELRHIAAGYTLYRILANTPGEREGKSYRELGIAFRAEARMRLLGYKCRVDIDGDGVAEIEIG